MAMSTDERSSRRHAANTRQTDIDLTVALPLIHCLRLHYATTQRPLHQRRLRQLRQVRQLQYRHDLTTEYPSIRHITIIRSG